MRQRLHFFRGVLAALFVVVLAGSVAAQTGRVGGVVKDEAGNPIKGATVTADNPGASPSSFTATTDDKGRFSIIGLKSGRWSFAAQAPGFSPETGKLTIYWANDIRLHWYDSEAYCYFSWVQMSGCAFDRSNAIEGKRRALVVMPFEIQELLISPQNEAWALEFANFFDIPIPPGRCAHKLSPPTRKDLFQLCQEEGLDFAVLQMNIDNQYCATSGKFYIYDCRELRKLATK
jgi:hypothetical protein